jgi:hypothetical protein
MDFQPPSFRVPIKIMLRLKKRGSVSLKRLGFHSITKIFDRDGEEGWMSLKRWDCIVNNIVDVFIVRKKGF